MKRSTKIKIIVFFIVFFLCFVDLRPLFRTNTPSASVTPTTDETRKSYNIGSCYDMTDDLCYFIIHLDDNESSWNKNDKDNFIENKFLVSLDYLTRKASNYSVTLSNQYEIYPTDDKTKVVFDGIVEGNVVENGTQKDIFNQVAVSMGYSSPEEMNSSIKEEKGVNQIAYLIVVNKEGRSYKYSYKGSEPKTIEFCVFFNSSIKNGITRSSTIAHEILHLFGAEDYYDPYGKLPEREKLAKQLYPNDIMLSLPSEDREVEVGAYTAYCVGWTNTLPEECNVENWWK